ncbi:MAG: HugZ family protein [Methylobacteriaceae bacterium]|nr:HugZ family protein [Methylobacteriaceae bacterium]
MTDPATPAPPPRDPRQPADFDAVVESKRLLRVIRSGALATLEEGGAPFVSLVNVATDVDGAPLLLVSGLSRHTRLLQRDGRCSLLLAQGGKGDPAAHPRLTVAGTAAPTGAPRVRARFLARHPKSALYADFPDFSFWRLEPSAFHINGGFARAADLAPAHVMTPLAGADELVEIEADALEHVNGDHRDAVAVYARMAKAEGEGWKASGIDPEGIDLQAGDRTARLAFPRPIATGGQLRSVLAELARQGRSAG